MIKDIDPAGESLAGHHDETDSGAVNSGALRSSRGKLLPGKSVKKPAGPKLVTTLTLSSRTCKWPIGDPAQSGFHYCGQPPQMGRPYCDAHDSMSYQTPQRKRS